MYAIRSYYVSSRASVSGGKNGLQIGLGGDDSDQHGEQVIETGPHAIAEKTEPGKGGKGMAQSVPSPAESESNGSGADHGQVKQHQFDQPDPSCSEHPLFQGNDCDQRTGDEGAL